MPKPPAPRLFVQKAPDHFLSPPVERVAGLEPAKEGELARIHLHLRSGQRLDMLLTQGSIDAMYEYLGEVRSPYRPLDEQMGRLRALAATPEKLLSALIPPDRYDTPIALSAADVGHRLGKERPHIRLLLKGGYELDIPLTQEAVDTLALVLHPFRSRR